MSRLLILTVLAAVLPAEDLVARVTADLRAADDARTRQAEEAHRWSEEQERLAVQRSALAAALAAAQARLATVERQTAAMGGPGEREQQAEALAAREAQVVAQAQPALRALAARLPGVPVVEDAAALAQALTAVRTMIGGATVTLASGTVAGTDETLAVRQLAIGGALWWLALDNRRGGTATVRTASDGADHGGQLELTAVADPGPIRHAVEVIERHGAAVLVPLPLGTAP